MKSLDFPASASIRSGSRFLRVRRFFAIPSTLKYVLKEAPFRLSSNRLKNVRVP